MNSRPVNAWIAGFALLLGAPALAQEPPRADAPPQAAPKGVATPAAAAAATPPAATVAGTPIELTEVDELVRAQLMELRAREYQLRSQALEALITRTLLEKEAEARGIDAEALDQSEVAAKVSVTDEDVKAVYAANKARLGGATEADGLAQVRNALTQQRQQDRRNAYARELRARYPVKVLLEPFRVSVDVTGAPARGYAKAPVTIVEFSDFQCPYCVRARPTVKRVSEAYGDRVRWVFRHYPLDFHPQAQKAGEAAACAGEQGRFWEMHDRLWENPQKLQVADLKEHAQALQLDVPGFSACLDGGRHADLVERDLRAGQEYGVSGTPAFFVNGRLISGAQPFEAFQQVIDDELARSAGSRAVSR
jgi:protein-disulfide isomerase